MVLSAGPVTAAAWSSGSDVLGPTPEGGYADTQQSQDKIALAAAWDAYVNGRDAEVGALSRAMGAALEFETLATRYAAKYGDKALPEVVEETRDALARGRLSNAGVVPAAAPPPLTNPPAALKLGSSKPLFTGTFPSYGQNYNFYCGPAAARNILIYRGGASAYNSSHTNPTQARLAKKGYLRTDIEGATKFAKGHMERGLNRWRTGGATGYYVRLTKPDANQLGLALRSSIYWNEAFAVGAVEAKGINEPRYNDHPPTNSHIGHWITAFGYKSSGSVGEYADPAWKLPSLDDASPAWKARTKIKKRFEHATSTFVANYIAPLGNGIVW